MVWETDQVLRPCSATDLAQIQQLQKLVEGNQLKFALIHTVSVQHQPQCNIRAAIVRFQHFARGNLTKIVSTVQ